MTNALIPEPVTAGEVMAADEGHVEKFLNGIFTCEVPAVAVPDYLRKNTVIGRFAHDVAAQAEMPFGTVFVTILGAASVPAACSFTTRFESGYELPVGLFTVCEQPPASGKTRVLNYGLHAYQAAIRELNKQVHSHNRAEENKQDQKPYFIDTITDGTTAAIDSKLAESKSGRLPLASSEQGLFRSLFPAEGGFHSNNDLLLTGWDGGWVSGARSTRNAFTGRVSTQIAMFAQNGSIRRVLQASNGSGLTERFLFVAERSNLGRRKFEPHTVDANQYDKAATRCVERMADGKSPIIIEPCKDGRAYIRQQRIAHEAELGRLERAGEAVMIGWLGKFENHVLKIASVIHAFEFMQNEEIDFPYPVQIPLATVEAACALVMGLHGHMRAVIDAAGESGLQTATDAILDLVRESRTPLSLSDVVRKARRRKPFSDMGNASYKSAKGFTEALIMKNILSKISGKIAVAE